MSTYYVCTFDHIHTYHMYILYTIYYAAQFIFDTPISECYKSCTKIRECKRKQVFLHHIENTYLGRCSYIYIHTIFAFIMNMHIGLNISSSSLVCLFFSGEIKYISHARLFTYANISFPSMYIQSF